MPSLATRPEPRGGLRDRVVRVDCGLAEVATRAGAEAQESEGSRRTSALTGRPSPACRAELAQRAAASLIATWAAGPRGRDGSALPG